MYLLERYWYPDTGSAKCHWNWALSFGSKAAVKKKCELFGGKVVCAATSSNRILVR